MSLIDWHTSWPLLTDTYHDSYWLTHIMALNDWYTYGSYWLTHIWLLLTDIHHGLILWLDHDLYWLTYFMAGLYWLTHIMTVIDTNHDPYWLIQIMTLIDWYKSWLLLTNTHHGPYWLTHIPHYMTTTRAVFAWDTSEPLLRRMRVLVNIENAGEYGFHSDTHIAMWDRSVILFVHKERWWTIVHCG